MDSSLVTSDIYSVITKSLDDESMRNARLTCVLWYDLVTIELEKFPARFYDMIDQRKYAQVVRYLLKYPNKRVKVFDVAFRIPHLGICRLAYNSAENKEYVSVRTFTRQFGDGIIPRGSHYNFRDIDRIKLANELGFMHLCHYKPENLVKFKDIPPEYYINKFSEYLLHVALEWGNVNAVVRLYQYREDFQISARALYDTYSVLIKGSPGEVYNEAVLYVLTQMEIAELDQIIRDESAPFGLTLAAGLVLRERK